MNFSIGCDIEKIERFENKISNKTFLKRVYTDAEISYCLSKALPARHLAARFCAKEAVVKALTGLGIKAGYKSIEIINRTSGYPDVKLKHKGLDIKISLSHCKDTAMAMCVAVENYTGAKK